MKNGIKLLATCMVAFALAFGVLVPAEDITADDGQLTETVGAALEKASDSHYGDNYVYWFSLAIVAILVLMVLAYLHVKAHKKD